MISVLISLLARVLLSAWIVYAGYAALISAMTAGIGARRSLSTGPSPGTRPTIRTVVRSGEMRPAAAGTAAALIGSPSCSRTGPSAPSTDAWTAASLAVMAATSVAKAGSSTVLSRLDTSKRNCCEAGACWPTEALAAL